MKQLDEKRIQHVMNIDIPQWLDGGHHFTCHVLGLIRKADPHNRRKIAGVYPDEVEAFTRFERIQLAEANMPYVGEILVCGKPFGDVKAGMLGVVYERYDREKFDSNPDDNVGVSIIWETGFYDGFSRSDLNMLNVQHTGRVDEIARYYHFENVGKLTEDFEHGWFDRALGKRPAPEPGKPRQNISLNDADFITLVSGGEVIKKTAPGSDMQTHIILQDIGFARMLEVLNKAMGEQ